MTHDDQPTVLLARPYYLACPPCLLLGCEAGIEGDVLVHMLLSFVTLLRLLLLPTRVESVPRVSVRSHQITKTRQKVRWDLIFLLGRRAHSALSVIYTYTTLYLHRTASMIPAYNVAACICLLQAYTTSSNDSQTSAITNQEQILTSVPNL